eukprot:m.43627 g.43627  ORF g.43627 m.43627 type:complete len:302 (-) comp12943_c1_seq1:75-980(-)
MLQYDVFVLAGWYASFVVAGIALHGYLNRRAKFQVRGCSLVMMAALVAGLILPWYAQHRIIRAVYSIASLVHTLRVVEALLQPDKLRLRSAIFVVAYVQCFHDLTHMQPVRPGHRWSAALAIVRDNWRSLLIAGSSMALLVALDKLLEPIPMLLYPAQHTLQLLVTSASIVAIEFIYRPMVLLAGGSLPCMHARPWQAKSLVQFWRQWNTCVQAQLHATIYMPIRRMLPGTVAIAVVFGASGLLHMYPTLLVSLSWRARLKILAFFLIQPLGMAWLPSNRATLWTWLSITGWLLWPLELTS